MKQKDGTTTRPSLLKRVAEWADHAAWCDFCTTYDPLIRSWCRGYGLDGGALEDLCQEILIKLADRMRTYQYDPGRTFRGWLRKFCHSRAVDLLRKRRAEFVCFLADQPADAPSACWSSIRLAVRKTRSSSSGVRSCCGRPSKSSTPWNKVSNRGPGKPSGGSP